MPPDTARSRPWASDRDLSHFLLRACHDLKSAVRAIRTSAELLGRDAPQSKAGTAKTLGFITDGARQIELLTDGLANYSVALQIERESFQRIGMSVALRTALARLDNELRAQRAEVSADDLPRVFGNPDRLAEVFGILLRNALRHRSEREPRIHISAERQGADWHFAVRDNGAGIEPAWLDRVFEPFERMRGGENEGVGLGLPICQAIVERHGGKLWAQSTPGEGSTFFFSVPAADD